MHFMKKQVIKKWVALKKCYSIIRSCREYEKEDKIKGE